MADSPVNRRFKITSQDSTLLPLSLNMAANPAVLEYLKYLPDDKLEYVHYLTICNATNMQHKFVWIREPDFLI
jgi:hypothetical protein